MQKLSRVAFEEVMIWIHLNARPLELAMWRYYFEDGDLESVIKELAYYQNADGGFGNKIDPDNWNPASSPYNTQIAIKILRKLNFFETSHPVYQGIFRFLEDTIHQEEYGWFFTIPSNDSYPRGVWWNYDALENIHQSIGTTASLSGFILRYCNEDSMLYKRAYLYTKGLIHKLKTDVKLGDMGVSGFCELLEDIEEGGLQEIFEYDFLREKVHSMVRQTIVMETDNFMANPLEFITSMDSRYFRANIEEVEKALERLIEEKLDKGVWDIPWEWYNNNKYPKEFAISENWWKGIKAIDKVLLLKAFNRLDI